MSNRCPHCGHENREKARFCTGCSVTLDVTSADDEPAALPIVESAEALADGERDSVTECQLSDTDKGLDSGTLVAGRFYVLDSSVEATRVPGGRSGRLPRLWRSGCGHR